LHDTNVHPIGQIKGEKLENIQQETRKKPKKHKNFATFFSQEFIKFLWFYGSFVARHVARVATQTYIV